MHAQTANAAIKRMGFNGELVAHGMRAIASTAMNEAGFNSDIVEAALAHLEKDEVRRAYNRSVYLEQRVELMQWWGDFVERSYPAGRLFRKFIYFHFQFQLACVSAIVDVVDHLG